MRAIKKTLLGIIYFLLSLLEPLINAFILIVSLLSKVFGFIYLFGMIIYMYENGIKWDCLLIAFLGAVLMFISKNIGLLGIWYEELLFKLECWMA